MTARRRPDPRRRGARAGLPARAARAATLVMVAALAACTTPPAAAPLPPAVPARWLGSDGTASVDARWWENFGDPVLGALVDEALARNLDLRQAAARLDEAAALAAAQHGAALPQLDGGAGVERLRDIGAATGQPYYATNHAAQFQAAWELDLRGRIDALERAADADRAALAAARDAVALSVAATVASGYFRLRALDAQLDLARRTLASRERSLALTVARERNGYGSTLESAQARAELRATAQTLPELEQAIDAQQRALDLLLARAPGPIERGRAIDALRPPALPGAGLPSQLLRRRPDLASAEWQLTAADARFAAARAQLLPALRLTASFGSVGSSVLRGDPFGVWSIGGSVLAPLFNGGQLRALASASGSRRDQALIGYERAVLTAFAEVELQLGARARLDAQLAEVEARRAATADALRIATRRHAEGYASYLDELLAQRSLFAVEQQWLQLRADRLATDVALYRALGGGWGDAAR
ncbi:efflux transporter outer membrane subunit [Derxia lacustris]|uniref:efflux transporter outer membrane subunit n=1 Tax=Derxia lacustris TaxID=764842 RepID=UPI001C3854D9|nr:efflux transporter outer membrane subunit [Derxia lacustris]